MFGWHHQLDRHEFEQAPGDGEGQGSLVCCSPWGCRVGHDGVTEQQQPGITYIYKEPHNNFLWWTKTLAYSLKW